MQRYSPFLQTKKNATHYTVNPLLGFTVEGSRFPICAVVLIIAEDAISWQATA